MAHPLLQIFNTRAARSVFFTALLAGCSSAPQSPAPDQAEEQSRPLTEIEQLLLDAEQAPPLAKAQYTLEAAGRLLNQGKADSAETLLNQINPLMLTPPLQQRLWLLHSRIADQRQQPQTALEWLRRLNEPTQLDASELALYHQVQQRSYSALGDSFGELRALMEQSDTSSDQQALADRIWESLQQVPAETLREWMTQQNSYKTQGWIELGEGLLKPDTDVRGNRQALEEWFSLWGLHPAATLLPTPLARLRSELEHKIDHIGIWLPQSGPFEKPARAIIDGLIAAYQAEGRKGTPRPRLSFYDSNQYTEPDPLYRRAQEEGVDLLIGPLEKDRINQLADYPRLDIPTLGLNYVEHSSIAANLYQFGLRGEDEARQAADQAWADGHRIAFTLTPATAWGDRILATFRAHWQSLGGAVAGSERFRDNRDVAPRIRALLSVDQSESRADEIRQLTQEKLEFDARRRSDGEFIFLAALNKDARQIKPTLAFYYASELPVYATSHIFDGESNPDQNRDLDGVIFTDLPWMLSNGLPLRADIERQRPDARSRFGRLYALGIDAYQLAPYLTQLSLQSQAHFDGVTGSLRLSEDGELSRTLPRARFSRGRVRSVETP